MDPRQILHSPARRRVYEEILASPGVSMSQLARRTQMYWTAAAFHVSRLTTAGLVTSLKVGRRRLLFVRDAPELRADASGGLLAEPACRRIAMAVARCPGLRVWELAELTGMSERSVYHHLKRLSDADLVASPTGRSYRGVAATPRLHVALAALRAED